MAEVSQMPELSHDVWVFAYGSLMWQPGFTYIEACHASLAGYHRAFCVYSVHYRGTPRRPGLVLGLDRGGTCEGLALRLDPGSAAATLGYLRRRELIYGVYREALLPVTLFKADSPRVLAFAFIAERAHPAHAGTLPLATQAALIRGARGTAGTNLDYLINSLDRLAHMGIRERMLGRLLGLAGGAFAARDKSGAPARPRAWSLARVWGERRVETPRLERERRFTFRNKLT
jgi:cation transport protein ChaC